MDGSTGTRTDLESRLAEGLTFYKKVISLSHGISFHQSSKKIYW